MTPEQILKSYDSCKHIFGSPLWWVRFLRVAASGEKGVPKTTFSGTLKSDGCDIIRDWINSGLIKKSLRQKSTVGRPRVYYILGPKGHRYVEAIANIGKNKDQI